MFENIIALAKRRGFFYPSSEIYGGLANTWDFGHYGTLLKNNFRDMWWQYFVMRREDMVGIEASIFLNPKAWEASGHVAGFTDMLIDCKKCKLRMRADHLIEDYLDTTAADKLILDSYEIVTEKEFEHIKETKKVEGLHEHQLDALISSLHIECPNKKCHAFQWTPVRKFNLLFGTEVGIVEEKKAKVYLRGEIAQGIFLNFKNVLDTMRVKIPFGIAQQGKAFRNEITMGQSIFRTLEFDLMEFEYFIREEEWEKMFNMWKDELWKFSQIIGIDTSKLRWRDHDEAERAHYSKGTADLEYKFPFGFKEMWAVAYRTNFDLSNHTKHSGEDLTYRDPKTNEKFIPHVIEPTFGMSRGTLVLLVDAYREEEVNGKIRTYLKFDPKIAPVKAAVFPLQKDDALRGKARELYESLRIHFSTEFDDAGNIGKMYRRQDEIGTPYCITVDYQTLEDHTVTVRERDTMAQTRIPLGEILPYIQKQLEW